MAKKILEVIETAHRATLEEQDDPILWLAATLRGAGTQVDVLLRGNAVGYLVRGQDARGLAFGARKQSQAPHLDEDVSALLGRGAAVYYLEEDLTQRGVRREEIVDGARAIKRATLAELFADYDQVWSF